jgi:hypothetical protein
MSMTPESATRDALVCRIRAAMTAVGPEGLTTDELRMILPLIEGAYERICRLPDNVVRLDDRRRMSR